MNISQTTIRIQVGDVLTSNDTIWKLIVAGVSDETAFIVIDDLGSGKYEVRATTAPYKRFTISPYEINSWDLYKTYPGSNK